MSMRYLTLTPDEHEVSERQPVEHDGDDSEKNEHEPRQPGHGPVEGAVTQ